MGLLLLFYDLKGLSMCLLNAIDSNIALRAFHFFPHSISAIAFQINMKQR